jgi:alginate O-acetyltransferase complex protein AlgJ
VPQLSKDVFEGDDGHLFLVGGSNDVARLFSESDHNLQSICSAWKALLADRKRTAANKGVKYLHCFVPDKLSVLRARALAITSQMRYPAEILEESDDAELRGILVPLTKYLRKQAVNHEVFHRTDTHWTVEGCFSAYQMLCSYMGIPQKTDLIMRNAPAREGSWDLGSKLTPKRFETVRFGRFGIGASRVEANEIVTARETGRVPNDLSLHVGSLVEYRNERQSLAKVRLLVFGDSFFEYRPHMLTGMFAETVDAVMFVWSAAIDWKLVDEFKPDILLTELAERFVRVVPKDDVDIRRHATNKLQSVLCSQSEQRSS